MTTHATHANILMWVASNYIVTITFLDQLLFRNKLHCRSQPQGHRRLVALVLIPYIFIILQP